METKEFQGWTAKRKVLLCRSACRTSRCARIFRSRNRSFRRPACPPPPQPRLTGAREGGDDSNPAHPRCSRGRSTPEGRKGTLHTRCSGAGRATSCSYPIIRTTSRSCGKNRRWRGALRPGYLRSRACTRPRGSCRAAHGRVRAHGRQRRRHRRPHRRTHRRRSGTWRGVGFQHRQGSRRRFRAGLPRPGQPRAQGRGGRVAIVRGRLRIPAIV